MRLKRLKIGNGTLDRCYKNFLNTTIEFNDESNYCTFIGLNGSGKSNLLEAISKIFRSLYLVANREERVNFDFELDYLINIDGNTNEINIKFRANNFSFKANTSGINQGEYINYLPKQIIANYSGETSRLWDDIYLKFYEKYTDNIRQLNTLDSMQMLYLNKFSWDIALITLLCLEDVIILDMLGLSNDDVNSLDILFKFDTSRYPDYDVNPVIAFIDDINPDRNNAQKVPLVNIKLSDVIEGEDTRKYVNLFNYLYVAYMPKNNKIITEISIKFNHFDSRQLSEGEKKMILVRLIKYLSTDKESLILLDEPDSHVHVSRKRDLANTIIENEQFTIITTHSPTLINHFNEDFITMLIPSDDYGIETKKADSFEHIQKITDNSFSLLDTSLFLSTKKHILMCEGINDLNYIKKALEVLNSTQDNKYINLENIVMINCGGAGNVKPIFEDIVKDNLDTTQICIMIFDDDDPGRKSSKKIQDIISEDSLENVVTFTHPKINPADGGDFYMEDYFSIDAYKSFLTYEITSASNFKSLDSLTKAKNIINSKYKNFNNDAYEKFSVLFDKLLIKFNLE